MLSNLSFISQRLYLFSHYSNRFGINGNQINIIPKITTISFKFQTIRQTLQEMLAIYLIKRTFQPSLIRRKRKHGFLWRKTTVGGRRVLKRRTLKKRKRLAV